ncbi:hypothetical protein SLG_30930 [Sphingobium sp. SYK-6]|uniref:hypothetical protein n=1 Tax=Sphingobium sp. (strain NBRC 103272 / SYK-6) TaxID=627192 RepID=UPI00022774B6|nr:hypothetical protein [Sphingobium sp. SYK-6]BAK67768.1 hypothetical protein SLG_30930 [Sphingobium sp. SYK-6]
MERGSGDIVRLTPGMVADRHSNEAAAPVGSAAPDLLVIATGGTDIRPSGLPFSPG